MEHDEIERTLNRAHKLACEATSVLSQQLAKRSLHRGSTTRAIENLEMAKKELKSLIAATAPRK